MPTALDFHRATMMAFKNALEAKSPTKKDKHVSIQITEQFNYVVVNIKKEHPEAALHLPKPITWRGAPVRTYMSLTLGFLI